MSTYRQSRYADLGSVSEGTLRSEDLLPAFVNVLEDCLKRQSRSFKRTLYRTLIRSAMKALRQYESVPESNEHGCSIDDFTCDLQDALDEFAPPYCYFGTLDGDGACFGFWLTEDWQVRAREDDIPCVDSSAYLPEGYRGEWFHVSDHGNVTLYVRNARGKSREVWSIV